MAPAHEETEHELAKGNHLHDRLRGRPGRHADRGALRFHPGVAVRGWLLRDLRRYARCDLTLATRVLPGT